MSVKYYGMEGQEISQREALALFNSDTGRRVAADCVGDVDISTVLLCFDHGFDLSEKPLIFETMIFGGKRDQECWRYSTKEDALEGHRHAVMLVEKGL